MSLLVDGQPFDFKRSSPLLQELTASSSSTATNKPRINEVPFGKGLVQAWDEDAPAFRLTLEQQLGVIKVRIPTLQQQQRAHLLTSV